MARRSATRDRDRGDRLPGGLAAMVVLAALALPAGLSAQGAPPHWQGELAQIDCTSQCHTAHHALGGQLSPAANNVNLCQSCHNPSGLAKGFPINNAGKAVRGQTGTSHAFDVLAVNAALDTQLPQDNEMLLRVKCSTDPCPDLATRQSEGRMVCSTCHDQHTVDSTLGGTPRVGTARKLTTRGSPDGLTAGGTFGGTSGVWYLVELATNGSENAVLFGFSKDGGTTWFPNNCSPGSALPDEPWQNTSGCLTAASATPVGLDSGVTVTFAAGSYVARERWEFSAAWPFLRAQLASATDGSLLCRDCHRSWDMTHTSVEAWNNGSTKSHPIGVGLNANSKGYDRGAPLDGNGGSQSPGDGNPSNDLVLDAGNKVHCLTCHGVHHADGNTKTVDRP